MANDGLSGPFDLTTEGVQAAVTQTSAGAYALGNLSVANVFYIHYAGRADSDVADRLLDHVPERYTHFKAAYYQSALAAFIKECELYHDFSPPDNKIHPARSGGTNWKCPRCSALG